MQYSKIFARNTLRAFIAWILYNTFFFFLSFIYSDSTLKWRVTGVQMPFFYDAVAPILLLVLYVLAFVGFFSVGKNLLTTTGLHLLNFVFLALSYAILWMLLGWVFASEHTSMGMTNFLIICLADALDSRYLSHLNYNCSVNAFVMAIPFICMFIGLTVRQIQANKAIGGSDEKAAAKTDAAQSAEAAQSAAETDKPKGTP